MIVYSITQYNDLIYNNNIVIIKAYGEQHVS